MSYAELVYFAIQAAIQLLKTTKNIYVDNAAGREISLPLPLGLEDPMVRAIDYGESLKTGNPPRHALYEAANSIVTPPAAPETRRCELLKLFGQDLAQGRVKTYVAADPEELRLLAGRLAVSEWMNGHSPNPTPLQRIAGVLVELGVEYFAHVPGALDENTRAGKTVKAFLTGLESFDFQNASWDSILIDLITTALDTIKDHPELLPKDDLQHKYISTFLTGLATTMNTRLAALPAVGSMDAVDRMKLYSQMLLRSALVSAGNAALNTPGVVNISNPGVDELAHQAGAALLDLLLGDTGPGGAFDVSAALRRTLSADAADKLLQGALKVAAEHPDLFGTKNALLQQWIKDLFTGLYGDVTAGKLGFNSDLFPEIAYLVMSTAVTDLPGLLPPNAGAGAPALLIGVARGVFEKIAVANPGQPVRWNFNLSQSDVRALFAAALDAVGDHAEWFIKRPGDRALAGALIGVAIDLLNAPAAPNLKDLINAGTLDRLMAAVLASGLADKLRTQLPALGITPAMLSDAANEVIKAIAAGGTAGILPLLESGAITDLLSAVSQSQTFAKLFAPGTRGMAAAAIAKVVQFLRQGQVVSIPDLILKLDT
ncbi:MAG TPA: hypothetical protein VGN88_10990 [Phycisphaerae bacterium]